jgi:hypothetical protein
MLRKYFISIISVNLKYCYAALEAKARFHTVWFVFETSLWDYCSRPAEDVPSSELVSHDRNDGGQRSNECERPG